MSRFLLLCVFLCTDNCFAVFPENCHLYNNIKNTIDFNQNKKDIYLLHNTSINDVWFINDKASEGASAGFSSKISPKKWSAIVVDKTPLSFACIESKKGSEQRMDCMELVEACVLKKAQVPATLKGSFWLTENQTYESLMYAIEKRGVSFKANI